MRLNKFRRKLRFLVWIMFIFLVPYMYIQLTFPVHYVFKHSDINGACIIPKLDPFDPSILKFVWDPKPLVCDSTPSILYTDHSGAVQFNQSALKLLHVSDTRVLCKYRYLIRSSDDVTVSFSEFVDFRPPLQMKSDFSHIICQEVDKGVIFDQLVSGINPASLTSTSKVQDESPEQLSVLMFGLDSVSRSAAIRKMPKTLQYLNEQLKTYDFKGYMKVGENTLPNLVPLLTGLRVWSNEVPIKNYLTESFDPLPFLWRNFSERGYATAFAEDMPNFGTFTYYAGGFRKQPTDHYFRPFWLGVNELEQVKSKLSPVFLYLENKNVKIQKSSSLCYKDKTKHTVQIDYLKQFITAYKGKRKFMFSFLGELSHEYPNLLANGDDDFLDFFKWLKSGGHLENSVLIFFSDHGARIDEIRNTFVGRIEVRMPLMHIYIPEHIKSKYRLLNESLVTNTERLSVPFDVHQMIVDVMTKNFENPSKSYMEGRVRGHSLFHPLPPERSCRDAWFLSIIVPAIHLLRSIFQTVPLQIPAQTILVYHFSSFFEPEKDKKRYDISVVTVPGYGIFEGSYLVESESNINLLGAIVRVNRYGDQPCTF
ncbi:uncharacterized protein LOC132753770 [Ruditapes philippinarum]|uniref:uncharacterized protein LOC132753770 n=1 Tax=Ruditapes philippinarum TaxID=129788 RepID=UPI00295BC1EB|nr:uncharacterized protein LOC132753770 [Ruditapes philippinarum]